MFCEEANFGCCPSMSVQHTATGEFSLFALHILGTASVRYSAFLLVGVVYSVDVSADSGSCRTHKKVISVVCEFDSKIFYNTTWFEIFSRIRDRHITDHVTY